MFSQLFTSVYLFPLAFVDYHVESQGCEDQGIPKGTCGIASIKVNGKEYSRKARGINFVALTKTSKLMIL